MKHTREVIPMEKLGDRILSEISRNDSLAFTHMGYQKRVITWHPYPKDKPTGNGDYLVTLDTITNGKIDIAYYGGNGIPRFFLPEPSHAMDKVVAWAELPKPYKEET